jgi:hypothetical protein
MPALVALGLVLLALVACLVPLLGPERSVEPHDYVEEREAERARLIASIRDADLDLAMGKISAKDHAAIRASLETQAVSVLAALDDERAERAEQDREQERERGGGSGGSSGGVKQPPTAPGGSAA